MGNDPERVTAKFSAKGVAGKILQGHKHCYFLPLDFDNDGYLDHMLVRCRETFDDMELLALDRLESIWQEKGKPDIRCIPLQRGCAGEIAGTRKAKRFRNGTPFVPTHHYRKGRGDFAEWLRSEVRREARNHGLPEPVGVQPIAKLRTRAREYRWLEFRRTRKGEDRNLGFGFEIEFTEPVVGPFSLGREAHFGLGLFIPEDEQ